MHVRFRPLAVVAAEVAAKGRNGVGSCHSRVKPLPFRGGVGASGRARGRQAPPHYPEGEGLASRTSPSGRFRAPPFPFVSS